MRSSLLSTHAVHSPRPTPTPLRTSGGDDDLNGIVDGLFQDANAIDERNRQLLQRIRSLQNMIANRQRELD